MMSTMDTSRDNQKGTGELFGSDFPGRYWHRLDDGRVKCDLCPRFCKLREGQRGLCFVRAGGPDGMVLTTYAGHRGSALIPLKRSSSNIFCPAGRFSVLARRAAI